MYVKDLLKNINNAVVNGNVLVEVEGLTISDSEVKPGYVYFCINGTNVDGHEFAVEAVSRGAVAVVCERALDVNAAVIIVPSVRKAMSIMAADFYGRPADKLRLVGITGTNGKMSTCHIVRNILRFAGHKVGVIGTLGISYGSVIMAPELTTPDPIFLHKIFCDMVVAGVEIVVMEVSAHSMELFKTEGLRFEVGVFTNFTQDHLDFFGTMQKYSAAKQRFLTPEFCDFTVFNTDDDLGRKLFLAAGMKSVSYGIDSPSDVFAVNVKESLNGVSFVLNLFDNVYKVRSKLAGRFSVYNCLAAATCCAVLDVDFEDIICGIETTEGVSGRIEQVKNIENKMIFVDYAHTPDGLKNVLLALRKCTHGRLICVFGCGGNRDKTKRSIMGEIAGEYADFSIITSDNPRYEEPCDITAEIEKGIRKKSNGYITIQDRRSAIEYGINIMKDNDVLLIAGKGAEEYQEVLGVRHRFNDKRCVQEFLGMEDGV